MANKKTNNKKIAIFEGRKIRRVWDNKKEKWFFSVIDVIAVLTDSVNPRDYWFKMKVRVKTEEGAKLSTFCRQLKLQASDGKYYLTDVASVEEILRIIQSVPSLKAEPFKLWLARVGYERVQEMSDPEKALNRSRDYWQKMGRSKKWIQQRMMGQEIRNKLTDYWKDNEVKKQDEYAILTNIIHQEWSDLSVKEHKSLKKLKTQNLRDHMSDAELVRIAKKNAPVCISVMGRLAVLAACPRYWPGEIEKTKHFEKMWQEGEDHLWRGSAYAHFFMPEELEKLVSNAGVEIIERVGLEGLGSNTKKEINKLARHHPKAWKNWLKAHCSLCTHPAVFATSGHMLIVGRKPTSGGL